MELSDGLELMADQARCDQDFEKKHGIRIEEQITQDDFRGEVTTLKLTIHSTKAFPLTVCWMDQDVYMACRSGPSGVLTLYKTIVCLDQDRVQTRTVEA